MKNLNKRVLILFLGSLSISSSFSASGASFYQHLCSSLNSATDASSQVIYSTIQNTANWVKDNPIKTISALSTLFGLGYQAFKYCRDQRTANPYATLLYNPATGLNDLYRIRDQFQLTKEAQRLDDFTYPDSNALATLTSLIHLHEQKSPIFLLGECREEGFDDCLLSRTYQPKYREQFEKRVVDTLVAKLESSPDTIHYVGFGSGGMYQDLVIACKALASKPNASLSMHLIDAQYNCFADVREKMKMNPQVDADAHTVPSDNTTEEFRGMFYEKASDHVIKKTIQMVYTCDENKARQFIAFLQKTFPDAQLTLNIYKNSQNYLDHIQKENLPYPDVISAADIDDDHSLVKKSIANYADLSRTTLQQKPTANNILLTKLGFDRERPTVQLVTLLPNETDGATLIEIELPDGQKVNVFLAKDDI